MAVDAGGNRLGGLDALRGLAVVLMVLDHVLAVADPELTWSWLVRLSITRAALPLFMFCTGYLLAFRRRGPSAGRLAEYVGVGLAASLAFWTLGLPFPDPVLLIASTVPLWPLIRRWPVETGMVGVIQAVTWELPWTTYQPGVVIALLAFGVLSFGRVHIPGRAGVLGVIGRRPLAVYLVHVVGLMGVAAWLR